MSGFNRVFLICVILWFVRLTDGFRCCLSDFHCKNIEDNGVCRHMDGYNGDIYANSVCLSTEKLLTIDCVSITDVEDWLTKIISDISQGVKPDGLKNYFPLSFFLKSNDLKSIEGNEKLLEWNMKLDEAEKKYSILV